MQARTQKLSRLHPRKEKTMRPFNDIYLFDVYEDWSGSRWTVTDLCPEERMIKVVLNSTLLDPKPYEIWTKNTDSIFNCRLQKGFRKA